MGAAVDLGLITSPEEFIPRAGAVHLNTHVLGSSINLAEVHLFFRFYYTYFLVK